MTTTSGAPTLSKKLVDHFGGETNLCIVGVYVRYDDRETGEWIEHSAYRGKSPSRSTARLMLGDSVRRVSVRRVVDWQQRNVADFAIEELMSS